MEYQVHLGSSGNKITTGSNSNGEIPNLGKILVLFVYAFASFIIPISAPLIILSFMGISLPQPFPETKITLLILAGIFSYCGLQMFVIWPKIASWATTRKAISGTSPVTTEQLISSLTGVNSLDVPFVIKPTNKPNEFIAEWKVADQKWMGLMLAGGLTFIYKLHLYLKPEKHLVNARETQVRAKWNVSGGVHTLDAGFNLSFFRGINLFQFAYGKLAGLLFKDGKWTIDTAYNYTFNPDEVKSPVSEVITKSGWDFVPII